MYIPKRYGESKKTLCPFCERLAITQNKQKIPVCRDHKEQMISEIGCLCGNSLELRHGKFGPFFFCTSCGNINFKRGLEIMQMMREKQQEKKQNSAVYKLSKTASANQEKKEIVVTSDELDFLY